MNYLKLTQRLILIVLLSFIAVSCEKDRDEAMQGLTAESTIKNGFLDCEVITDLIAGQHMDVGDVRVFDDGVNIYVTYEISEPGWGINETHLHIADELSGIPHTRKGNPKIGHFAYQMEHSMAQNYTYVVPLSWPGVREVVIAAHAVVDYDYMGVVSSVLPADAGLYLNYPTHLSYFTSVVSEGGILNNTYEGWCIDVGHYISYHKPYEVIVFSSYGDLSNLGNVDYPEHLDKVNWVINQDFVGKQSTCCGAFTYSDVQRVIWELVDADPAPYWVGHWPRVSEILVLANKYGEGYMPQCDENMAIILEPTDDSQVTIIEVPVAQFVTGCDYGEETAWAKGKPFPGNSWAMYFEYTICQ